MKKQFILAVVTLLYLGLQPVADISAQQKKLYDLEDTRYLPSFLYRTTEAYFLVDRFAVTFKTKYFSDEEGNKVYEGPVNMYGEYYGSSQYAKIEINTTYSSSKLNGEYTGTYFESSTGMSCKMNITTKFTDNKVTDYFNYTGEANLLGNTLKYVWNSTHDPDGKISKIVYEKSLANQGVTCSLARTKDSLWTGSISLTPFTFELKENIISNYYMKKSGDMAATNPELQAILEKYIKGESTLSDVLKTGYTISDYENELEFELGNDDIPSLGLYSEDLGVDMKLDLTLKIVKEIDLYTYDDLKNVFFRDGNNAKLWNFEYDEKTCALSYKGYYSTEEVYAMPEDVALLRKDIDVAASKEAYEVLNTLLSHFINHTPIPSRLNNRDIKYDNLQDYREIFNLLEKWTYEIDSTFVATDETLTPNNPLLYVTTYDIIGGIGDPNGLHQFKMVQSITIDDEGDTYHIMPRLTMISTEWDEYRTVKSAMLQQIENTLSSYRKLDEQSCNNFAEYLKNTNINATESYEESMKAIEACQKTFNEFQAFCKHKIETADLYNEIITKASIDINFQVALRAYYNSIDNIWKPGMTAESLIKFEVLQNANKYLELSNEIKSKNIDITIIIKNGKTLGKSYKAWFESLKIEWTSDVDLEAMEEIIATQTSCLEMLKDPEIKTIDKAIKKAKITDIHEMINQYKK